MKKDSPEIPDFAAGIGQKRHQLVYADVEKANSPPITSEPRNESRAKISCRVDAVCSLHAQSRSDTSDEQEEYQRVKTIRRRSVITIRDCQYDHKENSRVYEFLEECIGIRDILQGIRSE
jgi:hypothetical protein